MRQQTSGLLMADNEKRRSIDRVAAGELKTPEQIRQERKDLARNNPVAVLQGTKSQMRQAAVVNENLFNLVEVLFERVTSLERKLAQK